MITNYQQALDYFSPHEKVSKHYNLDAIRAVCEKLWNPHNSYKIIHIAGTNGKGSVSQMCFSILKKRGKKVGIFTSPHLITIRERWQTNKGYISKQDFTRITNIIQDIWCELSFFEKCCVLWFLYFQQQWCEYAIIEVGLGGLLDSTNIVQPIVTSITSIGYDHMNVLGDTLEEIASQKAGIIKSWIPIVLNFYNDIIEQQAKNMNASIIFTDKSIATNLHGDYQTKNAALVYEICHYFGVPQEVIHQWLQQVSHPGRLDYILPNLLVDGAHNEQWLESLKTYIDTIKHSYSQIIYCFSTKAWKEKDVRYNILERFGVDEQYIIVDCDHYLLATIEDIIHACENISYTIHNLQYIRYLAKSNKTILYVVFWSLYMIGWLYDDQW